MYKQHGERTIYIIESFIDFRSGIDSLCYKIYFYSRDNLSLIKCLCKVYQEYESINCKRLSDKEKNVRIIERSFIKF